MLKTPTRLCCVLGTSALALAMVGTAAAQQEQPQQEGEVIERTVPIETPQQDQSEAAGQEQAAEPQAGAEQPVQAEAETGGAAAQPPDELFIERQEEGTLLASELIGTSVVGAEDEEIGDIEDIILHPEGGIFGATVSVGGFLGLGAKEVALSWSHFEYSPEEGTARIDSTRAELEEAPDFQSLADLRAEEEAMAQQQETQQQGAVPPEAAAPAPAAGPTTSE